MSKEILYFGDPMCSWCWGFAPVLKSIYEDFKADAPLSIVVGGLHAYCAASFASRSSAKPRTLSFKLENKWHTARDNMRTTTPEAT